MLDKLIHSSMAAATPLHLQNKPHHHHHHHRHRHLSSLFSSSLPLSIKTTPLSTSKPSSLIISSKSNPPLSGRKLRAAVIGGGPAGSSAAETLAAGGIETFLFERSPSSSKPCGGAIPLCMLQEFSIPPELVDRRVTRMKIISPSNLTVDFGKTLKPDEYIAMLRREVLDSFLRRRAESAGATAITALVTSLDLPSSPASPYIVHYTAGGSRHSLAVDVVIGADGANSRVAKSIKAGDYSCAIAFQERIKIPEEKMEYYQNLAEMYVGNDVSPDFYAWVFPKCDHVAVGTGTVCSKQNIKQYQRAIRERVDKKNRGGGEETTRRELATWCLVISFRKIVVKLTLLRAEGLRLLNFDFYCGRLMLKTNGSEGRRGAEYSMTEASQTNPPKIHYHVEVTLEQKPHP